MISRAEKGRGSKVPNGQLPVNQRAMRGSGNFASIPRRAGLHRDGPRRRGAAERGPETNGSALCHAFSRVREDGECRSRRACRSMLTVMACLRDRLDSRFPEVRSQAGRTRHDARRT